MGYPRGDYGYRGEGRERGARDDFRRDERHYNRGYDDDRGFFDRAGDEVRSWFGDEEAERRRERDQREYERERALAERSHRGEHRREPLWRHEDEPFSGGSAFGGDYGGGRRFDQVDLGSTGTHTANTGSAYGTFGPRSSFSREYAAYRSGRGRPAGGDPHYEEWRSRQIEALDRDYDDYRRENQSQFEREFGSWRETRRAQRASLARVGEHMEVVGSDGEHLGTVDKVRGDRIILTKSDPEAGGHHHSIPCGWIDKVEDKVVLNKSADQARRAWTDEETSRALFESEDRGSEGPHALDRAFKGTY